MTHSCTCSVSVVTRHPQCTSSCRWYRPVHGGKSFVDESCQDWVAIVNSKYNISLLHRALTLQLGSDTVERPRQPPISCNECSTSLPSLPPCSDTKKYDRGLSTLLHDEFHWLDVSERVTTVTYKLGVMMYRCLHGQAPRYLADHLIPASEVASRLRLRSANRPQLIVTRCRLSTYGRRAFSIAGPTVWNSLPEELV